MATGLNVGSVASWRPKEGERVRLSDGRAGSIYLDPEPDDDGMVLVLVGGRKKKARAAFALVGAAVLLTVERVSALCKLPTTILLLPP